MFRRGVHLHFAHRTFETGERANVAALAQTVLDARLAHPDATLADLYDPDVMPADLQSARAALDRAVDRLDRRKAFADAARTGGVPADPRRSPDRPPRPPPPPPRPPLTRVRGSGLPQHAAAA